MPRQCTTVNLPGGGQAIVCRDVRSSPCATPGCSRGHTALCDYPLTDEKAGQTCDRKMCDAHRHPVGLNLDYCGPHFAAWKAGK